MPSRVRPHPSSAQRGVERPPRGGPRSVTPEDGGLQMGMTTTRSRRAFLRLLAGTVGAVAVGAREAWAGARDGQPPARSMAASGARAVAAPPRGIHPEPRPGVDGSRVLDPATVAPHVTDLYARIREIPEVVDGIGCWCGCAEVPGMYSLLSCYEESGMAQYCDVCRGEGLLAVRLHDEGADLDAIRAAIDRRFG